MNAVDDRFVAQMDRIAASAAVILGRIWAELPGYDAQDVEPFTKKATPILNGAQQAAFATSLAYYGMVGADAPAGRLEPLDQNLREPFIGVWTLLKNGSLWSDAVADGGRRAGLLSHDRVAAANREAAFRVAPGTRWRRIPNADACKFCRKVAAYSWPTAEAASFGHGHKSTNSCGCRVVPAT